MNFHQVMDKKLCFFGSLRFDGGHISFIGLGDNYDTGLLEIDQVY